MNKFKKISLFIAFLLMSKFSLAVDETNCDPNKNSYHTFSEIIKFFDENHDKYGTNGSFGSIEKISKKIYKLAFPQDGRIDYYHAEVEITDLCEIKVVDVKYSIWEPDVPKY
jgi:hypothetical protein